MRENRELCLLGGYYRAAVVLVSRSKNGSDTSIHLKGDVPIPSGINTYYRMIHKTARK